MAQRAYNPIPAASGYPQYAGNLIHPMFGQDLIEEFYCTTVFGEITTTDYIGDLVSCGDQITFWSEPQVQVRDHVKDGTIQHDTIESKPITLTIDKAKEFSVKMAKVDQKQMCNWDTFRESMLRSASRRSAEVIDCEILSEIYADAHPANRGANAGVCTGGYNLGEVGAPLEIDKDNVLDILLNMQAVFDEQCVPQENRWVVVPPKMKNVILASDLRSVCFSGLSQSTTINGRMPDSMAGFDVYVSNRLATDVDPGTNRPVVNMIAGWKGSTVFASQLEHTRVIDDDKDTWDSYYQGLMVYGYGTIRPEGLMHVYATLG